MAWPAPFPGWLLEPGGDAWPRGMTVTPQGAQDPAYRPTPLFLLASPARCFVAGAVRPCESVGHQLYPGHPWPYFSRSFFALIHECGFIAVVRDLGVLASSRPERSSMALLFTELPVGGIRCATPSRPPAPSGRFRCTGLHHQASPVPERN